MKQAAYPLTVSGDLIDEVRQTCRETGLSLDETIRQSLQLGLPQLRHHRALGQAAATLKPFTPAEAASAFAPDPEWDRLERAMTSRPMAVPEDE